MVLMYGDMLPPFIIEQLREREERAREKSAEQPRLELPLPGRATKPPAAKPEKGDEEPRGPIEIQIW